MNNLGTKKKGMTALKAAKVVGTAVGTVTFLNEVGLADQGVIDHAVNLRGKDLTVIAMDRLNQPEKIVKGIVKGVFVAAAPPIAVVLSKRVISFIKTFGA